MHLPPSDPAAATVVAAVALASAVAALTPTPKVDELVAKAYKFLDLIALNIGKAKQ